MTGQGSHRSCGNRRRGGGSVSAARTSSDPQTDGAEQKAISREPDATNEVTHAQTGTAGLDLRVGRATVGSPNANDPAHLESTV